MIIYIDFQDFRMHQLSADQKRYFKGGDTIRDLDETHEDFMRCLYLTDLDPDGEQVKECEDIKHKKNQYFIECR